MTARHYLLSAAAVFLALALGVVLGARVLPAPMVREDNPDQTSQMDRRLTAAEGFITAMSGRIVRDALAGRSVVLFTTPDAEPADVDALAGLVTRAGGSVTGTVGLTAEFVEGNAGEKLRSVVVSPIVPAGSQLSTTLTDASAQAGDLLGIALLINRDAAIAPVDAAARDTVLATLRDTGFLTYPPGLGAADLAVIVTGGALAGDAGNQGTTVARLAAALAPHGSGTVLAGRDSRDAQAAQAAGDPGVSAVSVVRADAGLAGAVGTVDDVGTEAGRITTVLALRALLDGGPAQSYGVGPGATALTVPQ